ncbi:ABC transporter permease [Candidatus Poriferisocius sp.]|uniref:ABC transporter permease n=1 Tax=Candidatus Poriferisocius sp. TaxID=3101276 RepID=UPI003B51C60A
MSQLLEATFWSATVAGGLRLATPLIYASIGETFAQRAGVLNLGLEGYMIIGALTSLYVADPTVAPLGFLVGGLAGMLLAAFMVLLSIRLYANQVVVGFGLTILGIGTTGYIFRVTTDVGGRDRQVSLPSEVDIPLLSDIPWLGDALFGHSWYTWLALGLVLVTGFIASRTIFGLEVKAVGEDPDAAAARGVDVVRVRTMATLMSGFLGGLGGAALMLGSVGRFQPWLTANRGFIALIVIIMASWSIWGAAVGAFVFGFFEALGFNLNNVFVDVPVEGLNAIPFFVALLILTASARWARMPRGLGENYVPTV